MPRHVRLRSQESTESPGTLDFPEPEAAWGRRRRKRGLIALLGSLGALVAVVLTLTFSPLLELRAAEVHGNELLTNARANELLSPLAGTPLPQVSSSDVRELLAEENVVDEVSVHAELPHTVHVEIVEHQPVASVEEEDGVSLYSEQGEKIAFFTSATEAAEHSAPQIEAETLESGQQVFSAVAGVLGELPSSIREELESASAESIDSVQLTLDDGRTVVWGSMEQGEAKAAVLEAVLLSEEEVFLDAEIIDISTPSTPVTR